MLQDSEITIYKPPTLHDGAVRLLLVQKETKIKIIIGLKISEICDRLIPQRPHSQYLLFQVLRKKNDLP